MNISREDELSIINFIENKDLSLKNEVILSLNYEKQKRNQTPVFILNYINKKIQNRKHRLIIKKVSDIEYKNSGNSEEGLIKILNVISSYNNFKLYKLLMKNKKIDLTNYFKTSDHFENEKEMNSLILSYYNKFKKEIDNVIKTNNANKLKKGIINRKKEYLCNESSLQLFIEMVELGFTKKEIQENIGKKINTINNSEEFNSYLKTLISLKKGWNKIDFLKNIDCYELKEDVDYEVIKNKNAQLILNIKTFDAAKALGAKMWCISRDKELFIQYKNEEYSEYYFMFNFNELPSSEYAMIAIITDIKKEISDMYSKTDSDVKNTAQGKKYKREMEKLLSPMKMSEIIKNFIDDDYILRKPFDDVFDFENYGHKYFLYKNMKDFSQKITKDDMTNKEYIINFNKEEDLILKDNNYFKVVIEDIILTDSNFIKKMGFLKNIKIILNDHNLKKAFFKNIDIKIYGLASNERFDEFLFLIKNEEVKNYFKDKKNENIEILLSDIMMRLLDSDRFTEVLKSNESLNTLQEFFDGVIKDEDKENFIRNVFIDLKDDLYLYKNQIQKIIPKAETFKVDLASIGDYKDAIIFDTFNLSDKTLKYYNFNGCYKKLDELIIIDFLKTNEYNETKTNESYKKSKFYHKNFIEKMKRTIDIIKKHDKNYYINSKRIIEKFKNINIDLIKDKNINQEKTNLEVLLYMSLHADKKVNMTSVIENILNEYLTEKYLTGFEPTDRFKSGMKKMIDIIKLNNNSMYINKKEIICFLNDAINKVDSIKKDNIVVMINETLLENELKLKENEWLNKNLKENKLNKNKLNENKYNYQLKR